MTSSSSDSYRVFETLVNDRSGAKAWAIRTIDERAAHLDRAHLRSMLMKSLSRDFRAPTTGSQEEPGHADTRCWLLSALGRVADDDSAANAEMRRHLNATHEPYEWARFWALDALAKAGAPDARELAQKLADPRAHETPLVAYLAKVILTTTDEAIVGELRKTLREGSPENQWAIVRGLRVVPNALPSFAAELFAIVERGNYDDVTFDAIVGLGLFAPKGQHAQRAAQCLVNYLVTHRWPMYDSMRIKALIGLGNLRVERTASVLIEELSDDSPGIVYEASRSLEKVLGVRTTTARILETAERVGPQAVAKFATALRWMDRKAVVEALEAVMLTSPDAQQDLARALLSEVGGQYAFQRLQARTNAANQYIGALEQAEERIRNLFETSIEEARHGFRTAIRMDIAVFVLGVALIVVSSGMLLLQGKTLDSWAGVGLTGGAGVLGVLYSLLIARPRDQVRQSVDHLMYLKVIFLGYLRQLHQTDQAYTRRLLDDDPLPAQEVAQFGEMVGKTMVDAIAQLSANNGRSSRDAEAAPTPAVVP